MEGLLLVDKPKGWTSFDVVNYVRRIVATVEGKKPRNVKVGHIGTLDPAATGLLVLCVGKYTKKVPELIKQDKTYEAELMCGATSTTGDAEGVIAPYGDTLTAPSEEALRAALEGFVGEIQQTPPQYSAIKVNGKRAYELARDGKVADIKPRTVVVHSIVLDSYKWPVVRLRCSVGSGTYIRTLAEDIGAALGVGAYLTGLRRTEVGHWNVADAVDPKSISIDNVADKLLA